jgi:thioredoxin reductase
MTGKHNTELPVAVIGAGPVGLAAAAQLVARDVPVKIYEAGNSAAASVREWQHVRLFSPWQFNMDEAAKKILREDGWQEPPADVLPTGRELIDAYLDPLARTPKIAAALQTKTRVQAISRRGIDKVVSRNRENHPFALTIANGAGPRVDFARAVIDASGTWRTPNPLGASGNLALDETLFADRIAYGIPDVLGKDRGTYAGKRVLVIGGGHSAANALLDLARLAQSDPHTEISWAVRSSNLDRILGGGSADQLPARGKLGSDLKTLTESGRLRIVLGFFAENIVTRDDGISVRGQSELFGSLHLDPVDRIIVATGFRPDLSMTRELRLDIDPWLECPRVLGPMIVPNLHSCGTIRPHGYKELSHPELNYFPVGIKSYGRAPTFLMATGYEQARSVVAHLAGDEAAANDVQLVLPETGVCSTNLLPDEPVACCTADAVAKSEGRAGCGCA